MSVTPQYNMVIQQGFDFTKVMNYKNPDNTSINLSGWGAKFKAKKADGTVVINLTEANGITLTSAGKITIHVDDTVTANYSFDKLVYTLGLYPPAADNIALLKGVIVLERLALP